MRISHDIIIESTIDPLKVISKIFSHSAYQQYTRLRYENNQNELIEEIRDTLRDDEIPVVIFPQNTDWDTLTPEFMPELDERNIRRIFTWSPPSWVNLNKAWVMLYEERLYYRVTKPDEIWGDDRITLDCNSLKRI